LGNDTKHKGATKGYGKLAVRDCYGDEELKGNERSANEELREVKSERGRSHMWHWDSNPSVRGCMAPERRWVGLHVSARWHSWSFVALDRWPLGHCSNALTLQKI